MNARIMAECPTGVRRQSSPLSLARFLVRCCLLWTVCLVALADFAMAGAPVTVHLFSTPGCPHCRAEKEFLTQRLTSLPQVTWREYDISRPENQELLRQVAQKLQVQVAGVPFTVIGERSFTGWLDDRTSGSAILAAIEHCLAQPCPDLVGSLLPGPGPPAAGQDSLVPGTITLPVIGTIRPRDLSLPLFTILMGAADGFNPCAMWVLVFLIGLLLGLKERRRMWLLGGTFIVVSAGVYFLFMAAWLNLLTFLGLIGWVRLLVGLVSIVAGFYNLKEFFLGQPGVCKVTNDSRRQRVFQKLKDVTHRQHLWLALGGIIVLAFMVNLVELLCSASLPVVYLQVLTLNNLPAWQYYLYITLYIFIFMLDDLIVFVVAMTTLQFTGLTGKFSRQAHLWGGLGMLVLGLLLIFRPEWLQFG